MLSLYRSIASTRVTTYISNLLVSFSYFLVIYINSTFLTRYVDAQQLSWLYIAGSIVSVVVFLFLPRSIRRFGNWWLTLGIIALEAVSLAGMGFGQSEVVILASFIVFVAVSPVLYLNLDIFLEKSVTDERTTGSVRGIFLTMQNITQVVSPFLVGLVLIRSGYPVVYVISLAFLLAAGVVVLLFLRTADNARYHVRSLWQSTVYMVKHPLLGDAVAAQFILRFFYAWMVIYTPLYLSSYLGFSWPQIGTMFAVMLLPFLLLELPLGRMTDKHLPARTLLVIGFVLMAFTVALMPFLGTPVFFAWTALLFVSRVGASCVEVGTESYFFRHVDAAYADTITLFRVARPATYIVAAVAASLALLVLPFRYSFFVLAAALLIGLFYAFALKERKRI